MTGSTGLVFVDTNVLVYFRDSTEPEKQRRAGAWMAHLWESGRGRLGCEILLSEDLQDGQELGRLVVRNPFRHPPPAEP